MRGPYASTARPTVGWKRYAKTTGYGAPALRLRETRSESDRYLESGSYFRLRNLQVGYTLPTVWFHGFVQKARVYVNAENLFTISSYSGYTPDVNSSDVYSRGFDEFIYPSNRTFMFGLNVTF